MRNAFRSWLIAFTVLAVIAIAADAALGNTTRPPTVPVLYQPEVPVDRGSMAAPVPGDFMIEVYPDPLVLTPLPEPPTGKQGNIYNGTAHTKTETKDLRAWRWEGYAECMNVLGDYGGIDCSDLQAEFDRIRDLPKLGRDGQKLCLNRGRTSEKCYTNAMYIAELHYGVKGRVSSWQHGVATYSSPDIVSNWNKYVAEEIKWATFTTTISSTRVVKANNSDPVEIPTYDCNQWQDDPDTTEVEGCQVGVDDDANSLTGARAPVGDDWTVEALVQFVVDYSLVYEAGAQVEVADRDAAWKVYEGDRARIQADNQAAEEAYDPTPTTQLDKARFDAAEAAYEAWKAEGKRIKDAYIADDNKYEADKVAQTGMFVDCKLDGCIVVNPVR